MIEAGGADHLVDVKDRLVHRDAVDALIRKARPGTAQRVIRTVAPSAIGLAIFAVLASIGGGADVIARVALGFSVFWLLAHVIPGTLLQRIAAITSSRNLREQPMDHERLARMRRVYQRGLEPTSPVTARPVVADLLSMLASLEGSHRQQFIARALAAPVPLVAEWPDSRRQAIQRKLAELGPDRQSVEALAVVQDFLEASGYPRSVWPVAINAALALVHCEALTTEEFNFLYEPLQNALGVSNGEEDMPP